jgi:hypothetical protein
LKSNATWRMQGIHKFNSKLAEPRVEPRADHCN